MIAAHYGFSDVFDNLIISLCKFTTLSSEVSPCERKRPQSCSFLTLRLGVMAGFSCNMHLQQGWKLCSGRLICIAGKSRRDMARKRISESHDWLVCDETCRTMFCTVCCQYALELNKKSVFIVRIKEKDKNWK